MKQKIKNKDVLRFKKACEQLAKVIEDILINSDEGETFDDISKAYDTVSECINYRIGKKIKPRKCMGCEKEDCMNCNDDFNRCPTCNETLDDDYGSEPKFCENCGQALIWYTEDGFSLRG